MKQQITDSFHRLKSYCQTEQFKGWDPYDGLNSKVFNTIPGLNKSRFARLAWIQAFKRNPINLRKFLLVPKGYNPKGLGLFLHGYCNLYHATGSEELLPNIRELTDRIIKLISKGYSGACWGYNFDWQAKAFFQPAGTPTVVASTFIGYALYEAYEILGDPPILNVANSVSDFILNDLNRTYDEEGNFSFSYSPLDHSQVFNATLLGSRMLARTYSYTGNRHLIDEALKSVRFSARHQNEDGSWAYSTLPYHQWIDSFHTGYNLECLSEYQRYSGDNSFKDLIARGFQFYMDHFFLEDGRCKYYHNSLYPIDIHASAQFIVTLVRLNQLQANLPMAEKVLSWMIEHMQDKKGYFYFQIKKGLRIKIPYIRWSQSWMFFAMSEYLLRCTDE
jgi:rhamnogalacturonyl hydrolase YesR